jgi:tRNA(fMet)-specific endonuclease VapC
LRIRSEPEIAGNPIGANDLLIAAHASVVNAAIVTANVDVSRRIHGLRVENWFACSGSAGER